LVRAASGNYEAMILGCIDPRIQEPVREYAVKQELIGQYSQFTIAGAAIGVVAPAFKQWHTAFWDNLAATIELHNIKRVIAIDTAIAARRRSPMAMLASPRRRSRPKPIARR
jgi:hypothetical protein